MNKILEYNAILLKYIILISIIILLGVICYNCWNRNASSENFSQISLEKQVSLYDDYRNYIDGKDYLSSRFSRNKRRLPYVVSPKCFQHKYQECLDEKALDSEALLESEANEATEAAPSMLDQDLSSYHSHYYPIGFREASRNCQENSIDKCLTDNFSQVFF